MKPRKPCVCPLGLDCPFHAAAGGFSTAEEVAPAVRAAGGFRLVQRRFGRNAGWRPVPLAPDEELARHGIALAGPGRDVSDLADDELVELLRSLREPAPKLSGEPGRHALERALLARCPFTVHVPPIDIDVDDESPAHDPGRDVALGLDFARRLDAEWRRRDYGSLAWSRTNTRGGYHGEFLVSAHDRNSDLLDAVGRMVRDVAQACGIPLLSDQAMRKAERTESVYVDDTMFNRTVDSRGVMWRLVGSRKDATKYPKTSWDIRDRGAVPRAPLSTWGGSRNLNLIYYLIENNRRTAREARSGPGRATKRWHSPKPADVRRARATDEDLEWLRSRPELVAIWEETGRVDRSKRDAKFTVSCLRAGADDARTTRLLYALPGGKANVDNRDSRYIEGRLSWAREELEKDRAEEAFAGLLLPPEPEEIERDRARRRRCKRDPGFPEPPESELSREFAPMPNWLRRRLEETRALAESRGLKCAKALRDAARCSALGQIFKCLEGKCEERQHNWLAERESVCPHCNRLRSYAIVRIIREQWTEAGHTRLVVARANASSPNPLSAKKAAIRLAQELDCTMPWRKIIAHDYALVVTTERYGKYVSPHADEYEVLDLNDVLYRILRAWMSVGDAFLKMVMIPPKDFDAEQADRVVTWSWIRPHIVRTSANKIGHQTFRWPRKEEIRKREDDSERDPMECECHGGRIAFPYHFASSRYMGRGRIDRPWRPEELHGMFEARGWEHRGPYEKPAHLLKRGAPRRWEPPATGSG